MAKPTRGTMVLSLDLELCWGRFDKFPIAVLEAESVQERTHIKQFVALLDRYEIPATWAMVGHLMLDGCTRDGDGHAHTDITQPARYYWFANDCHTYDSCTPLSVRAGWY